MLTTCESAHVKSEGNQKNTHCTSYKIVYLLIKMHLNSAIFTHKPCPSGPSTEFQYDFYYILNQPFKRDIYRSQVSNLVCLKCQVQKFKWSSAALLQGHGTQLTRM